MQYQSEFEQYVAICKRIYETLVESGKWRAYVDNPEALPT